MKSGIHIKQAEIWLIPFPYSDLTQYKKRPVLVLSTSNFNNSQENIIVCQISSIIKNKKHSISLETNNLKLGNIKKKSEIRLYNFNILHQDLFLYKIGKLNDETFKNCLNQLNEFINNSIFK